MPLFNFGTFKLHSGEQSNWKIDCDALVDDDWQALAFMIKSQFKFGAVIGISTGGNELAHALGKYTTTGPTLIVDDVLTTGASMEGIRKGITGEVIGIVVFARGKCPDWVIPIFQYKGQTSLNLKGTSEKAGVL